MSSSRSWTPILRVAARLALATAAVAGGRSAAQDFAAEQQGEWTIAAAKDRQGCVMSRDYGGKGGTALLVGLSTDATNYLSVTNRNWSIRKGERMPLDFRLSNGAYPGHEVVGLETDDGHGFVTSFEAKFPAYLATSRFLNVDRGDVPVARLPLDGSGAVAALRRCVGALGKHDAASDTDGRAAVPTDPFAERKRRRR